MATSIKDRNLFTPDPDPLFSSYMNPPSASPEFPVISEVDDISFGPMEYSPSLVDLTVDTDKYQSDKYGTLSFSKFKESLSGMSEGELRNLRGQIGGGMFGYAGKQAAEIPPSFMEAIDTEIENRASPFERDVGTTFFVPEWHRFGDRFPRTLKNIARTPDRLGRLGLEYFWGEGVGPEDEIQKTLDEMREGWQHKEEKDKYELEQRGLLAESAEVPEDFVGPQRGVPTTQWEDTKSYLKERINKPIFKKIGLTPEFGGLGFHPNYEEAEAEKLVGADVRAVDPKTGEEIVPDWLKTIDKDNPGLPPVLEKKEGAKEVGIDKEGKVLETIIERDRNGVVTDDQTKTISLTGPGIYESLFEREYGFLRPRPLDRSYRRSILFQKIGEQMAATGSVAEGFSKGSAAANQEIRKIEMEDVEIRNKAAERARDTYEALLAAQAATGAGLTTTQGKDVIAMQEDYGQKVMDAVSAQNSVEMVDAIVSIIKNDPRPKHGAYGVMRNLFEKTQILLNNEGDRPVNKMRVLQEMLANIDIQALLAESGKTISDKDRLIAQKLLGAETLTKTLFQDEANVLTALELARTRYDEKRRQSLGAVRGIEDMVKMNPSWGQYLYIDPMLLKGEDALIDENGQIIDIRRRPNY
jgi:hypothetical protein